MPTKTSLFASASRGALPARMSAADTRSSLPRPSTARGLHPAKLAGLELRWLRAVRPSATNKVRAEKDALAVSDRRGEHLVTAKLVIDLREQRGKPCRRCIGRWRRRELGGRGANLCLELVRQD